MFLCSLGAKEGGARVKDLVKNGASKRAGWKPSTLLLHVQHAKKVVSDSLGLVDFAIGLVIFVLNLPRGKCCFLGKFKLQKDCNQSC